MSSDPHSDLPVPEREMPARPPDASHHAAPDEELRLQPEESLLIPPPLDFSPQESSSESPEDEPFRFSFQFSLAELIGMMAGSAVLVVVAKGVGPGVLAAILGVAVLVMLVVCRMLELDGKAVARFQAAMVACYLFACALAFALSFFHHE